MRHFSPPRTDREPGTARHAWPTARNPHIRRALRRLRSRHGHTCSAYPNAPVPLNFLSRALYLNLAGAEKAPKSGRRGVVEKDLHLVAPAEFLRHPLRRWSRGASSGAVRAPIAHPWPPLWHLASLVPVCWPSERRLRASRDRSARCLAPARTGEQRYGMLDESRTCARPAGGGFGVAGASSGVRSVRSTAARLTVGRRGAVTCVGLPPPGVRLGALPVRHGRRATGRREAGQRRRRWRPRRGRRRRLRGARGRESSGALRRRAAGVAVARGRRRAARARPGRAHRAGRAALGWAAARAVYVYVCAPSVRSAQWSARGPESGKQLARPHGCRTSCFMCVSSVLLAEMNIFYYRRARV